MKTDKYVNLHCFTFQNMQTELKYHDYSSTSCILKRTRFLSRNVENYVFLMTPSQKSSKKPILNRVNLCPSTGMKFKICTNLNDPQFFYFFWKFGIWDRNTF